MKSSVTSLLIVFCILFSSVPNMGQSCTCAPRQPSGNTTCERGQIAVCGVDSDGVCDGRCVGVVSTATSERELRGEDTSENSLRDRGFAPTAWPVVGKLGSGFGGRRNPFDDTGYEFHSGQDIDAPWGAPVLAGASGIVTFVGWQNGYGQLVVIDHGGGLTTRYGHLSHIDVELNQTVVRSEFIGRVGMTGRSTSPQLHYEVRINDRAVNPLAYLLTSQTN